MPTIGASLAASVAGWVIDGLIQPVFDTGVALILSLAVSTVVFFLARKWLIDLRGR